MTYDLCSPLDAAPLSDSGRPDGCSSGSHEGALPDRCQSHDAECESVVDARAGFGYVFVFFKEQTNICIMV